MGTGGYISDGNAGNDGNQSTYDFIPINHGDGIHIFNVYQM